MTISRNDLRARDVMIPEPVCVEPSTTIGQLALVFQEHEISGAPVVDTEGRVVGIVSKTDLIRRCSEGTLDVPPAYLFEVISEQGGEDDAIIPEPLICVEDFMKEDPVTVTPDTPAGDIAQLMFRDRVHRVVVVDSERFPVGIITSLDLLGAYSRSRPTRPAPRESSHQPTRSTS
jgi:CBS domain-containing protein